MKRIKAKQARNVVRRTPSDVIGEENVLALKKAGFVVLHLSELSQLRANAKSALDILSRELRRKGMV
jgi:hypothetical protein